MSTVRTIPEAAVRIRTQQLHAALTTLCRELVEAELWCDLHPSTRSAVQRLLHDTKEWA